MSVLEFTAVECKRETAHIGDAGNGRYKRRDEIRHERVDDGGKCGADNDADREVDDAAAQKELFELLKHRTLFLGLLRLLGLLTTRVVSLSHINNYLMSN